MLLTQLKQKKTKYEDDSEISNMIEKNVEKVIRKSFQDFFNKIILNINSNRDEENDNHSKLISFYNRLADKIDKSKENAAGIESKINAVIENLHAVDEKLNQVATSQANLIEKLDLTEKTNVTEVSNTSEISFMFEGRKSFIS